MPAPHGQTLALTFLEVAPAHDEGQPLNERSPQPRADHHAVDCAARLGSVKALRRLFAGSSLRFDPAGAGLPALTEPSVSPVLGLYVMAGYLPASTPQGRRRPAELTGRATVCISGLASDARPGRLPTGDAR
jgi:hypothetical protein